jgi:diaminobutyrate acetyltransferase
MIDGLQTRSCTGDDTDLVVGLIASCPPLTVHTPYTYWATLTYFGDLCLLASDGGGPAAFLSALRGTRSADVAFVWQIAVRSDLRRRGIARAMLVELAAGAQKLGVEALQFSVEATNSASICTFQSFARLVGSSIERIGQVAVDDGCEDLYELRLRSPLGSVLP